MKKSTKTFIGGLVIGGVVFSVVTAFAVSAVWATAFINFSLKQDEINSTLMGQTTITTARTSK